MSTLQATNLKNPSSASNNIVLDSSGRVALGTSDLTYGGQLTVRGASQTVASFMNSNFVAATTGTQLNVNTGTTTGNTNFQLQVNSGGGLAFDNLCLQPSGGRLLVGTTSATANGGVLQVSNGITFPATQSPCSDPNTLDDYEEGTWTPVIAGSSVPGTYQSSSARGWYRKIGSLVIGNFRIDLAGTVTGGGTGQLLVTGLPFTVTSDASQLNNGGFSNVAYMFGITIAGTYATFVPVNGTAYLIEISYDRTGAQSLDAPSIVGPSDIIASGFAYITL